MWPAFFQNGDFHGATDDRLETQKADFAAHLAQRCALCQGGFSPRGTVCDLPPCNPRDTESRHGSTSRHPHRLPFHQDDARHLGERYEIAGHMDKPDPAPMVPAGAAGDVQALVTHRQRRRSAMR